ncbi:MULTISPECIES: DUF2946 family protein [unclassified Paracoccus (in: a-proteobacteria)]|uniref:DUF2946 family protein n=1 Tax=unclassified Paracoccus (in: a-proteobacteria) TaxID=2688777 RepID=UPI0018A6B92F|nr:MULTISPECIES: DUF2946 family protein [unclassified Paracoccus (in: a-proteobacteria)]UXU76535.1 DUF2946 family protein [Paracoccus sp. SMMA_5]UXU82398.1 DUF2946 family protein [Paracoccus sp. SMMA_5_TC]
MLLLLVPFLLLSLMAQGTMLTRDPGGQQVLVVLCGDHQPTSMILAADGSLRPDAGRGHGAGDWAGEVCVWATTHGQPMLALSEPPLLPERLPHLLRRPAPETGSQLRLRPILAALARAPPTQAA